MNFHPAIIIVSLVLLTAGCANLGFPQSGPGDSPTTPSSSATLPATSRHGQTLTTLPAVNTPTPDAETACADHLFFWEDPRHWPENKVGIGYRLDAHARVVFVLYMDGQMVGQDTPYVSPGDVGVVVDAHVIPLSLDLHGSHEVRVIAYADANRNERYDPDVDPPCSGRNGLVKAVGTFNFSESRADYSNQLGELAESAG